MRLAPSACRGVALTGLLLAATYATPAEAQDLTPSTRARDIYTAAPAPLPTTLAPRDATGDAWWQDAILARHASGQKWDAGMRRDGRAHAALNTQHIGRNLIVVEDADDSIYSTSFGGLGGNLATQTLAAQLYATFDDRFDFIQILLDWTVNDVFAYYMPLSNDVLGIGAANIAPYEDRYDETEGRLQGYIFMNNWRLYLGQNAVLGREVFLQEIGHRWGAFVHYDQGQGRQRDLLGRDDAHWSYWLHSDNSALEGNYWQDNGDGTFTTRSSGYRISFSPLDRYLMGALPPEEVPPFFIIDNPDAAGARDSRGSRLNPASPPEHAGQLRTFAGTRREITIDDIIAAEGPRRPRWTASQREWRMATVLVVRSGDTLSPERIELAEQLIDSWRLMFEAEVRNELDLITALDGDEPPSRLPFGAPCDSAEACNPEEATACVALPDDPAGAMICSHRCADHTECGAGFCCLDPASTGNAFCYPALGACQDVIEEPGNNPNNATPGDNNSTNNESNNGVNNGDPGNNAAPQPGEQPGAAPEGDASGGGCACAAPAAPTARSGLIGGLGAALASLVAWGLRRR